VTRADSAPVADDWTTPGVYEVAPDIHRIPLPLTDAALRAVNVYAVLADESIALVDGGMAMPGAMERLASGLETLGRSLDQVTDVLVTHVHEDHYTLAVALRDRVGARIRLGEGERESIERYASTVDPHAFLAERMWTYGAPELAEQLGAIVVEADVARAFPAPDLWITDGDVLQHGPHTIASMATPGHTQGHFVFRELRSGVIFTGDHVLPSISPSVGFEPAQWGTPLADYLDSLGQLLRVPDGLMLPAHGPVTPSVHARVAEIQQHHQKRLNAVAQAVGSGATTPFEVADRMTWTSKACALSELPPLHGAMAVSEIAAHVDYLVSRRWLERRSTSEVAVPHPDNHHLQHAGEHP